MDTDAHTLEMLLMDENLIITKFSKKNISCRMYGCIIYCFIHFFHFLHIIML